MIVDELMTQYTEVEIPPFDPVTIEYTPLEFDYTPIEPIEFTPIDTKVDWTQVYKHYLTHPTSSYKDLSEKFGVSLKQVKKHGSRDGFARSRQRVTDLTASRLEENLADERAAANERHIEAYQQAQELIIRYLAIMDAQVEAAQQKAEAEGRVLSFKETPSTAALKAITSALVTVINGERVCLNLPTAIKPVPVGWKPPIEEDPALEGMTLWERLDYYVAQNEAKQPSVAM